MNPSERQIVIIGAGHAGFQCAASLRQEGFEGEIVLLGDEPHLPYQRPPLSKAYLLGKASAADLQFRPERFFDDHRLRRLQGRAEAIDRRAQRVRLQSGEALAYDHLVIATGSRPRKLALPGAGLEGVHGLQTLADAQSLRARLVPGARAVVLGAGFIGLEFAAVARTLGLEVLVLDIAGRALARAASAHSAERMVDALRRRGVQFSFGTALAAIDGADGKLAAVRTKDGRSLPADVLLAGIGAEARAELAQAAGLAVENGICVDSSLLTSDPAISAVGDVASFPERGATGRIRLESVQNATDQARTVAGRLMGKELTHQPVPWFWSDQGEMKLQIAGLRSGGDEHVLLEEPGSLSCTVLCIRDGALAAVETINRAADHMLAKRLLAKGVRIDAQRAAEPGFQFKALAAA